MSQSAIQHMGLRARLALKTERETHINLHAFTGKKVERTVQAAVELHPDQDLIATTIKAHQCETCWEELHTDHLIGRFESLRNAKRCKDDRKIHLVSLRHSQMLMDWHEEEMQAEAWLEIAIWDCLAWGSHTIDE